MFSTMLIVLLCGAAFAEEEADGTEESDLAVEEQAEAPADVPAEAPTVTYLDGLLGHKGSITAALKISDEGEDSAFFNRYHDPFEGDWIYLDNFNYRELDPSGEYYRFNLRNTGDPSYWASALWGDPGNGSAWASDYKFKNTDMPIGNRETWRSAEAGFQAFGESSDVYGFNLNFTDSLMRSPVPGEAGQYWEATTADFDVDFDWGAWTWNVDANVRDYSDVFAAENDYNSWDGNIAVGNNFGDNNYLEARLGIIDRDVYDRQNLTMTTYGIGGWFMDPLGIDNFKLIADLDWTDLSDYGPSALHPKGDSFDFDLEGRWRVSSSLWLKGAWSTGENDVTHSDQHTNWSHIFNPGHIDEVPGWITDTVQTDRTSFGGKFEFSDDFDFSFDFAWVDRSGLPQTDLVYWDSSTLWWDSENTYDFKLRYNDGQGRFLDNGNWYLLYRTRERENGARQSSTTDDIFSLNYSGSLNDEIWLYAGYGFLNTSSSIVNDLDETLEGTEFNGGLSWELSDTWDFYTDFWQYSTDDPWGFDQTSYTAGLGFAPDEEWEFNLEYYNEDGEFDLVPSLDYNVEQLKLFLTYYW